MSGRRAASRSPVTFAQTPGVADAQTQRAIDVLTRAVQALQSTAPSHVIRGSGEPEGVVVAPAGTLYVNSDGGANATLWVKESGDGAEGWVSK